MRTPRKKNLRHPCGERWMADSSLRPAFEDLVGAGAIIRHLWGTTSPEARLSLTDQSITKLNAANKTRLTA